MSSTPAAPPAGWYPAPDGSPASWWWDGVQWIHPTQQPQSPFPPVALEAPTRLAAAIQPLLIASGVMYVAIIGLEAFGLAAIQSYLAGNFAAIDALNAYDQLSIGINILSVAVLVATGVLWVVWQYRVAKQFPGRTRRSPGWHAGSWFIPIISLVYSYQNISDLWAAVGRPRPRWLIVWWLAWIIGGILSQIATRLSLTTPTLEPLQAAMAVNILAEIVSLVAVPFAVLVVRGITGGMTAAGDGSISPDDRFGIDASARGADREG